MGKEEKGKKCKGCNCDAIVQELRNIANQLKWANDYKHNQMDQEPSQRTVPPPGNPPPGNEPD